MASFNVQVNQSLPMGIIGIDATGKPIPPPNFDSPPTWASSAPAVGGVVVDPGALTATFNPAGTGQCVVTASGAVNAVNFQTAFNITVVPVPLSAIQINPGTPS